MKLLKFKSYDEYKQAQVTANRSKFDSVFAEDEELRRIAGHFRRLRSGAVRGLCHGVRNGYEVQVLRRLLPQVDITGTDISETAADVPHCIVWDMHDIKPEWRDSIQFIYSNSWDHTYDPSVLFLRWSECLTQDGRLYLPFTQLHTEDGVTEEAKYDSFGCSLDELITILQQALVVDDLLEISPRVTRRVWRGKLAQLRAGRLSRVLRTPFRSQRVLILVLRRRTSLDRDAAVR